MTRLLKNTLRRFRDSEDGSMVIPMALMTPMLLMIVISGMELGAVTIRHQALERGLDQTVRDVRLGTGSNFDHDTLKQSICDNAGALPNCMDNLQLEMVKLNLRDWSTPDASADCVDTALEVSPQREFTNGGTNEMMMLRACWKFNAISLGGLLFPSLEQDGQKYSALVATSAFVHEPL